MQIHTRETCWELVPATTTITRVLLDSAITLESVFGAASLQIRIETQFALYRATDVYPCNPEDWLTVLLLNGMFLKDIIHMYIHKSGMLELFIDGGFHLAVPPHDQFEAWDIVGSDFGGATCMPGGSVAFWQLQPVAPRPAE